MRRSGSPAYAPVPANPAGAASDINTAPEDALDQDHAPLRPHDCGSRGRGGWLRRRGLDGCPRAPDPGRSELPVRSSGPDGRPQDRARPVPGAHAQSRSLWDESSVRRTNIRAESAGGCDRHPRWRAYAAPSRWTRVTSFTHPACRFSRTPIRCGPRCDDTAPGQRLKRPVECRRAAVHGNDRSTPGVRTAGC